MVYTLIAFDEKLFGFNSLGHCLVRVRMLHHLRVGPRIPLHNRTCTHDAMQQTHMYTHKAVTGRLKPKSYSLVEGNRSIDWGLSLFITSGYVVTMITNYKIWLTNQMYTHAKAFWNLKTYHWSVHIFSIQRQIYLLVYSCLWRFMVILANWCHLLASLYSVHFLWTPLWKSSQRIPQTKPLLWILLSHVFRSHFVFISFSVILGLPGAWNRVAGLLFTPQLRKDWNPYTLQRAHHRPRGIGAMGGGTHLEKDWGTMGGGDARPEDPLLTSSQQFPKTPISACFSFLRPPLATKITNFTKFAVIEPTLILCKISVQPGRPLFTHLL